MSRKKTGAFLRIGVFLMVALLMVASAVRPVGALTEQEYNLYWQNSIFFYDPYECKGDYDDGDDEEEGGDDEEEGGGEEQEPTEWDGECKSVNAHDAQMENFYDIIQQTAQNNNLPWEGIMAIFVGESGAGKHEPCPGSHNPLGLQIKKGSGQPACPDGIHRMFNSYEEAFSAFIQGYSSIRYAANSGRFANDPYGFVDYIAHCDKYDSGCLPYNYLDFYAGWLSGYVCGVIEWAKANGHSTSGGDSPSPSKPSKPSDPSNPSSGDDGYTTPNCPGSKKDEDNVLEEIIKNRAKYPEDDDEEEEREVEDICKGRTVDDNGVTWSNGWINADTFPGYTKEVPPPGWSNETENRPFETGGPNKILLHSTEGQAAGLNAYPSGNHFAAHFTLDPVNQRVYQHYSINVASNAIKSYDTSAGVQIEIVGFSQGHEGSPYSLYNWTDEEWDYVAVFLGAIANEAGIPLTSSVSWDNPSRLSVSAFKNYQGVLGHMHAPDNDHVDPGNIWQYISEAIERNCSGDDNDEKDKEKDED